MGRLTAAQRLVLLFGAWALVLLAAGGIVALAADASANARSRVAADDRLQTLVADATQGFLNQETGERGYVLTGEQAFLQPFQVGRQQVQRALAGLRSNSGAGSVVRQAVDAVSRRGQAWTRDAADPEIQLRRSGDDAAAQAAVATGSGKVRFDALRAALRDLGDRVRSERAAAADHQDTTDLLLILAVAGTVVVAVVGAVTVGVFTRRWLTRPLGDLAVAVRGASAEVAAAQVTVDGPPEFEQLAVDIEQMRTRIVEQRMMLGRTQDDLAEQRAIVAELQRALLPSAYPKIDGFEVAVRYLASSEGANVGGDWYVVVPLDGGGIGVGIGDVEGHGLDAVADMAMSRLTLRNIAAEADDPSAALDALNRMVYRFPMQGFTTVAYTVIDPQRPEVRVSLAGHYPPALVVSGATPRLLEASAGAPIGVCVEPGYTHDRYEFPPNATLVLYTDGLVERRDRPGAFETRLIDALRGLTGDPVEICEQLLARLEPDGRDDVAIVAVRRR